MALCMMLSLAACGGSGASSVPASVSASAPSSGNEPAPADGAVLNIWCWNDEFQSRFNDYYPEVKAVAEDKSTTTLNDGSEGQTLEELFFAITEGAPVPAFKNRGILPG